MATFPTFQELKDTALSAYESAISVTAPVAEKAFLRVLSVVEGLLTLGLYKYAADQTKENLATTASIIGLRRIGGEYAVNQIDAIAAQLEITLTAVTDTVIPINSVFIGDANGLRYYSDAEVTAVDDVATIEVTCDEAGVDGSLVVGDTLTSLIQIDPDAERSATVTEVLVAGLGTEDKEDYRRRVITEEQTVGGGSNFADFRTWATQTPVVKRAFPYAGNTPIRNSAEFVDLDMEEDGTSAWTAVNATLSKETSDPYEGDQFLRAEIDSGSLAYVNQKILTVGVEYTIRGAARGDGSAYPEFRHDGETLWTGTTSTTWQEFEVTFTASSDDIVFIINGSTPEYADFDNIQIAITEYPGHVTVYIEADEDLDADGIPDQDLLDESRAYINFDQDTGKARPSLGLTDENLFVEPIIRTSINVEIRGIDVDAELLEQAKTDIESALDTYLRNATPYIQGLDAPSSQADQITDPLLSRVVQDVLLAYGGTCNGIGIGTEEGVFLTAYSLGAGELAKLGTVTYVG